MPDQVPALPEPDEPAPQVFQIRGSPVILDADVARHFGIETKRLNEQVRRNSEKFFDDFAFELTPDEGEALRSQFATSKDGRGGARYLPIVFTEHGVVMAATVLKSPRAVQATRRIVQVFVQARGGRAALMPTPGGFALPADLRSGLSAKLGVALDRVLDAIADPQAKTTVRDEAQAIAAEGLRSLKDYLRRAGVQNEKTLAEVRKLMAEAEAVEADTAHRKTETRHRELALLAKQLRLVIEAQAFVEQGSAQGLLDVLRDLGGG